MNTFRSFTDSFFSIRAVMFQAVTLLLSVTVWAGDNKVDICHTLPNGNVNLLNVSTRALPAHLAHGDYIPESEICGDGIDNDCDSTIDEEDCTSLNFFGQCPVPTTTSTCIINIATGAATCDNGNPTYTVSTTSGLVLRLDMSNWTTVRADVDLTGMVDPDGANWILNIGNSPSNNGWAGDSGHFNNDSEMQLFGYTLTVYHNDLAGNGQALTQHSAFDPDGDSATAIVCDSYFGWESSTVPYIDLFDAGIFQIDGDEPDVAAGVKNDQQLYIGINRTVGSSGRDGVGAQALTLIFGD